MKLDWTADTSNLVVKARSNNMGEMPNVLPVNDIKPHTENEYCLCNPSDNLYILPNIDKTLLRIEKLLIEFIESVGTVANEQMITQHERGYEAGLEVHKFIEPKMCGCGRPVELCECDTIRKGLL